MENRYCNYCNSPDINPKMKLMGKDYCGVTHQVADNSLFSIGFFLLLLAGSYAASIYLPNFYVESEYMPLWGFILFIAGIFGILIAFSLIKVKKDVQNPQDQ